MAKVIALGSTIVEGGKTYKVERAQSIQSCMGCAFFNRRKRIMECNNMNNFGERFGECSGMVREDKKYIVFKEIR